MKTSEIKDLSAAELKLKEGDLRRELFNLRFQGATGELHNPMRISAVKRDIARILTVLNQKAEG